MTGGLPVRWGRARLLMERCPELEQQLHRFAQQLAMQSMQIAACNRLHDVEERLARWILMSRDRMGSDTLSLTQEFLSNMLGTRRSSVTVGWHVAKGGPNRTQRVGQGFRPAETRRGRVRLLRDCAATA